MAAVRQELTEQQNQVRALTAQLAAVGVKKQQQKAFNDVFIELQLAKDELERKDKLVADLSGKLGTMKDTPEQAASWDSLEREMGGPQDPRTLAERLLTTRESAAVAEAVKGSGLPMEPKELAQSWPISGNSRSLPCRLWGTRRRLRSGWTTSSPTSAIRVLRRRERRRNPPLSMSSSDLWC